MWRAFCIRADGKPMPDHIWNERVGGDRLQSLLRSSEKRLYHRPDSIILDQRRDSMRSETFLLLLIKEPD